MSKRDGVRISTQISTTYPPDTREGVGIPLIAHRAFMGNGWSEWRPLGECLWADEIIALENVTSFSERVVM